MTSKLYKIKDLTPSEYNCWPLPGCPSVLEVEALSGVDCALGGCPEVFDTDNENYLIIGKFVSKDDAKQIRLDENRTLDMKIGDGEALISISKDLVQKAVEKVKTKQ